MKNRENAVREAESSLLVSKAALARAEMTIDGYEQPVSLVATLHKQGEQIRVDYAGTGKASRMGINSPKCYSDAYSVFGLKCLIAPEVPNNAGSLAPFEVIAPEGSIVHPQRPSPVTARHVNGQMLPDLMFGCLEQALNGQGPAESAGSIWVLAMSRHPAQGQAFNVMSVGLGGTGARPTKDGLSTTAFPSGVGGIPVEITEAQSPLVFWEKVYLPQSGGAGQWRGGLSQRIVIGTRDGLGFDCSAATFDRRTYPARGRNGGMSGAPGRVDIQSASGAQMPHEGKSTIHIPDGGRLCIELPGGGGFGPPEKRDPALSATDTVNQGLSLSPTPPRFFPPAREAG